MNITLRCTKCKKVYTQDKRTPAHDVPISPCCHSVATLYYVYSPVKKAYEEVPLSDEQRAAFAPSKDQLTKKYTYEQMTSVLDDDAKKS